MNTSPRLVSALYYIICALTFIGALAWILAAEPVSDDWFYAVSLRDYDSFWGAEGELIQTFGQAVEAMLTHFGAVNGRLANALHILFQPFPRWIEGYVIAAAIAGTLILLVRLSGARGKALLPTAMVAVFLLWNALPWYDTMQSYVYNMNYIVSSALSLGVLAAYRSATTKGGWIFAIYCLFCVWVGWWHEAFTVTLIAVCGLHTLLNIRSVRRWYVLLSLCAGMIINLCLGTWGRIFLQTSGIVERSLSSIFTLVLQELWPLWLAMGLLVLIMLIQALRPSRRQILNLFFLLVGAIVGAAAGIVMRVPGRGIWCGNLFAIVLTLRIATPWFSHLGTRMDTILTCVFIAAYGWWLSSLVQWQQRESTDIRAVNEILSPRGPRSHSVIYLDLLPTDSIPWWLGDKVNQVYEDFNDRKAHYSHFNRYRVDMGIAPEECRGLSIDEWPAIPGTAQLRGRWNQLFTADPTMRHLHVTVGPPSDNMPPVDRLLLALRPRDTYILPWWPIASVTPEGDTIYNVNFSHIPRTMRHRPIVSIDATPFE